MAAAADYKFPIQDLPGWVFYPGLESNGGDHKEQCPNHNKNKAVLAAHCEKVGAIAFNTNGWVKGSICAVPFQQFPGAVNGDGQGLYVRVSHAPYTPCDIPGWVFYQGVDCNGNDHKEQPQNHGKSKAVIVAHCDKVGAVAFNTNGWCKTKLQTGPFHAFPNAGPQEGLYVRVSAAPVMSAYDMPGWAFYPGKDSNGGDHPNQPQNHGKNKYAIAAHANQVGAVAFNTNGWCKSKVAPLPLHAFPNAGAGEGLYVRLTALPM